MSTHHQRNYLLFALAILVTLNLTLHSVSARFYPNASSIPTLVAKHAPPGALDAFRNFTGCSLGKTYDGLSKIKNYFQHFGYLPNAPPSNFTDDFDDALESAVRAYQKNFNLNVTGELDEATMNQLAWPRCGVADIINGTTSMNSGKSNTNDTLKSHTVTRYSFFTNQSRWPAGTKELTYAFDPEQKLDDVTKQVFANAFDKWTQVTTITFRETTSFVAANIKIGFYSGDHGDNEAFDGLFGKTLAHASSPTDGRFHLDKKKSWMVNGDVTELLQWNAVDLESVAVHEIGHLLGLGHSSVEEAVMYPTISTRTRKVELANDDIEGIQQLYGSNPSFIRASATTARDTSHGARHVDSLLFSLFFLVFCMFDFVEKNF